jgi:hypothetical protein
LGDIRMQTVADDRPAHIVDVPVPSGPYDLGENDFLEVEELPQGEAGTAVDFLRC